MRMAPPKPQALVFGASGISGWPIVKAALEYPTPTTFERVIGLTNKPLSTKDAYLPDDSRLELYSGIDLSQRVDQLVEDLRSQIEEISGVTHVYFTAYTNHGKSSAEVKQANVAILENSILAVERLCPNLQFWSLQTGGKGYGVEFPHKIELIVPFKESHPRIPQPYYDHIFYYAQVDRLKQLAEGKKWKFAEIRPDAIVGFVPRNNAMNIAQGLGIFLSMYASIEGAGAEVPFPGTEAAYRSKHTDTFQDILAHFHIFASFHPEKTQARAFNIADGETVSWESKWPRICEYFGLKGVGPAGSGSGSSVSRPTGVQWLENHRDEWQSWSQKNGLVSGGIEGVDWKFFDFIVTKATFDRQYDLSAVREIGFDERIDTVQGYYISFNRMKAARIIP